MKFEPVEDMRKRYSKALERRFVEGECAPDDASGAEHKFFHGGLQFVVLRHVFPEPVGELIHVCANPLIANPEWTGQMLLEHAVDTWRDISQDHRLVEVLGRGPLGAWHFGVQLGVAKGDQ